MRSALLLVIALLAVASHALTFDLPARKYRCFTEEIPSGVEVKIQYAAKEGYAQFIDVKLTNPSNAIIWQESSMDRATYSEVITDGGDYALCFYSRMVPGAKYSDGLKRSITLEFLVGTATQDYEELASKEHLKPLEVNLKVMQDSVRSLHQEYSYYKDREIAMRDTNEHMNAKVMWMTFGMMALIVLFTWWQVRHVKLYFRRKRMID